MDLGSGGIMLLPDLTDSGGTTRHLAVGAGKDGNIYVVNRDSMGHFSRSGNNIWQQLTQVLGNTSRAAASAASGRPPRTSTAAFTTGPPVATSRPSRSAARNCPRRRAPRVSTSFYYPGTSPVISANGSGNGIVWAHLNTNPAVLYAFDATNPASELYNSSQAGSRDQFGAGNKFITPMVADGKVFVGTTNGVAVFGLLN